MSNEIDDLKGAAGAYKKEALEARKKFIELRHRQDLEIRKLLIRTADRVAGEIRDLSPSSPLRVAQQKQLEKNLRQEAERLNGNLTKAVQGYLTEAVEGGAGYSKAVTVKLLQSAGLEDIKVDELFYRVNRRAVEACWQRTQKGLKLSDLIWKNSENFSENIWEIIRQAVVLGQDAVVTARQLEQYVRQDTKTLAKDYPQMMEHLKGRIPEDLSYEALRLARTETTAAFGKATVAAARASPGLIGIKWVLSKSHPVRDICDELAAHDEGLGLGVYAPGNEPYFPAHPNDMCFLVPVHEDPEKFVEQLKRWKTNPDSEPGVEKWYNEVYQSGITESENPNEAGSTLQNEAPKPKYYVNLTDLPEAAKTGLAKAWQEVLEHGNAQGTETLRHIDALSGQSIFANLSGTQSQVVFTPELIHSLQQAPKDSVLSVHNHPRSSSFSPEDLSILCNFKSIKYLTVIGHDGTRYLVNVGDGERPDISEIRNKYGLEKNKLFSYYQAQMVSGKMTQDEAWKEHSHQIIIEVAKAFGWGYERYL